MSRRDPHSVRPTLSLPATVATTLINTTPGACAAEAMAKGDVKVFPNNGGGEVERGKKTTGPKDFMAHSAGGRQRGVYNAIFLCKQQFCFRDFFCIRAIYLLGEDRFLKSIDFICVPHSYV